MTRDLSEPLIFDAADVVLVAEVVSSWGRVRDLILKPSLCADAGIASYLLVEREPELALILRRLGSGSYVEAGRAGAGESVTLPELGVSLEVDLLARRRWSVPARRRTTI